MSACNITTQINEEQCMTDSLDIINLNVSKLDSALVTISAASTNVSTEGVSRILQGHNISVLPLANNGTGYLTIGETVCPPWHIDQTGGYLYGSSATSFTRSQETPVAKVELNVFNGYPKFFTNNLNQIATLPAGWYQAVYKTGAMSYWSNLARWYSIMPGTVLVSFPASTVIAANPWPGGGDYATNSVRGIGYLEPSDRNVYDEPQANAQAAINNGLNFLGNGKPFYKNFYHPGGFLAVSFGDNPYTDNRVTTPGVTYDLYPLQVNTVAKVNKQVSDNPIFLKHLQDVVRSNSPMPGAETLRNAGGTYNIGASTIGAYAGGVLMQDGRVFLVPYYNTTACIYDPIKDTTITPGGTHPGNAAYGGGVLLADGRVFMSPYYGTNRAAIYNPQTNTTSFTDVLFSVPLPSYQTCGSVLLKDGRVFGVPIFIADNQQTYIYNPVDNTFVYTQARFPGKFAFSGGVLLPDGKVFLIPWGALQTNPAPAYVYDPDTDSTAPVPGWPTSSPQGFYGGVVMADGRVYCIPADGGGEKAYIYNPTTGTTSVAGGTYPPDNVPSNTGVQNFVGGHLLPDGRIFVSPASNPTARIYDPVNNTLTTPSIIFNNNATQNAFAGSVLLENGDVFLVPYSFTSGGVGRLFSTYHVRNFDKAALTGPYFNYY
jgi:hypothetical protein